MAGNPFSNNKDFLARHVPACRCTEVLKTAFEDVSGSMNGKRIVALLLAARSGAAAMIGRRQALQAYGATTLAPRPGQAAAPRLGQAVTPVWEAYAVRGGDATMTPSVAAVAADSSVDALAQKRAVFLGEHHDAAADHLLQAEVIARVRRRVGAQPLAVGFEGVQKRFQPQLDAYAAGRLTEAQLRVAVD